MAMWTCINHEKLRWNSKDIAVSYDSEGVGYYNHQRNIFFFGELQAADGTRTYANTAECPCPPSDLRLIPGTLED